MNCLISKFIDNELDLDDKIEFVDRVHEDRIFKDESIALLGMEKIIRADVVDRIPSLKVKIKNKRFSFGLRPMGLLVSAAAAALILFFILSHPQQNPATLHRFVIYRPDVTKAEIAGTFTGWQRIPMNRIGSSGYWDITVNLPSGEHRFTYILDGKKRFADPTVPTRELDDFGGRNSIISVESKT
ncbi:MAG: glycogen-binding domain-containing protein [Desulfobacterales bacterium]|jgi:hypothetical protein